MQIIYSPSAHGANSSGFFLADDANAPSDAFCVSATDHSTAINLPQGSTYNFTAPEGSGATGSLIVTAPSNSYLLAQALAAKLAEIDAAYAAAVTSPISYMGTSFQADKASQDLITGVMTASGGALPEGFMWYDADNEGVLMTYADLQGLAGSILMRGQPLFIHKQVLKGAARSASTLADIESITW